MHPDERVRIVAGRQHGCVSVAQLLDAGLTRRAVEHRLERGWLLRMHRGVYLVGPLESPLARCMAAVLAVGPDAAVSHGSAAAVRGVRRADGAVDVMVARSGPRSRPGIRVHHTADLPPEDVTHHRGLPVTSIERTLLDLATTLTPHDLERAVEQAQISGLTTHAKLVDSLTRRRPSRGVAALRAAMRHEPQLTRSEAERRFLRLVREARLPEPAVNTRVGGYEVDFLWPSRRLIVEIDGYGYHSSRAAFERDRARDVELQGRGYRILRFTPRRVADEPVAVIAAVAAA